MNVHNTLSWWPRLLFLAALTCAPVAAQEQAACSYDRCALRFEGGNLLEGLRREPVGRVGTFYGDLRILEAGPDSASEAALAYQKRAKSGFWLRMGGVALMGVALVWGPSGFDSFGELPSLALQGSGIAFTLFGVREGQRARAQLAQAIWHYNRGAAAGMLHPDPTVISLRPSHYGHVGAVIGGLVGIAVGLLATSDLSWDDAAKGFLITGGMGAAGGTLGWAIGAHEQR